MSAPKPPFVEDILAPLTPSQRAHAIRIADAFFAKHGALYAQTADPEAIRRIWEVAREDVLSPSDAPFQVAENGCEGWPEPIPLTDTRGLPDFPTEHLTPWLRDFVEAVATEIQTPRCVPAMIALSVVSAALARRVALHVRHNWMEPLNLYTATALGPSNLKTPAFKMACSPLEQFERESAAAMREDIVRAENTRANLQAQLDAARRKAVRAKTEVERSGAREETEELAKRIAAHHVPRAPQLVANDVTEESLGKLLAENHGRIAVMSDEGGPFRNMAGRYQKSNAPVFDTFKHGHNAGTVRVNRVGRDPIHVPNVAITLALMVQPAVLRSLKQTSECRGEGLLARFLYAVPESLVGSRRLRANGVPPQIVAAYRDRVMELLSLPFASDDEGGLAARVMEMTEEARDLLLRFREELEPRLGRGGDLSHVSDWVGKLAGATARIAAILNLSARTGHVEPWRQPVTAESMGAALSVAHGFLLPHGLAAFSMIGGGPTTDLAEEIVAWLRRHRSSRFTKRDLHRSLRRQVTDAKEWDAPLLLLVDHGWIRETADDSGHRGGRPSWEFDVNPIAFRTSPQGPSSP